VSEENAVAATGVERWGFGRRFALCFALVYLVLYLFPFPLEAIPWVGDYIALYVIDLWGTIVQWVGPAVFGLAINIQPSGSGDTTFNYVQVFCIAVVAVVLGLVLAIAGRKRWNYARLHHWLRVYVRFGLASIMLHYGAVKVIQAQFPPPGLSRLIQPFGDSSPMGLLWTFMGASRSYNAFSGLGEMLGGFLLTMRRTTLLGALVSAGVLANVVMLNFSYDVPVKLYSLHLLAMALFLALPDFGRLARFFVLNRSVEPAALPGAPGRRPLRLALILLRTVLVAYFLIYVPLRNAASQRRFYDSMRPSLYGIWRVDEYSKGGVVVPPLLTEETRWRRVIFDRGEMGIQYVTDSRIRYRLKLEEAKHELALTRREDPTKKYTLVYEQPVPTRLIVTGVLEGENVRAVLNKVEEPKFLLHDRGFHWITEYPFNR
jgi:hypothetical protein